MYRCDLASGPLSGRALRYGATAKVKSPQVSRRSFIAGSLAATTWASGAARATDLLRGEPSFLIEPTRFLASWGPNVWRVDCAGFSGRPQLSVSNEGDLLRGLLRNARFPGTSQSADLQFRIVRIHSGKWSLSLSLPSLSIDLAVDLAEWLSGTPAPILPTEAIAISGGMRSERFQLSGRAETIDSSWIVAVGEKPRLTVAQKHFVSDRLSITLCAPTHEESGPGIEIAATKSRLVEASDWLKSKSTIRACIPEETAFHIRYQRAASGRSLLIAEPESAKETINVRISTAKRGVGAISVENYRLAEESGSGSTP
jgi:hypothetical protein